MGFVGSPAGVQMSHPTTDLGFAIKLARELGELKLEQDMIVFEKLLEAGRDLAESTVSFDDYLIRCALVGTPPDAPASARSLADLAAKARELLKLYEGSH